MKKALVLALLLAACDPPEPPPASAGLGTLLANDVEVTVGAFALMWKSDAQQLLATHPDADGAVFSSVPGSAFVMSGRASTEIFESRGLFDIDEAYDELCWTQNIEEMSQTASGAQLRGTLACPSGEVAWRLEVSEPEAFHLRLHLIVETPGSPPQAPPAFDLGKRAFLVLAAAPDERFVGFGEQFAATSFQGVRLPIIVSEQGIGRGAQPVTVGADLGAGAGGRWHHSYAPVPHTISTKMRSYFLEDDVPSFFDLRTPDRVVIEVLDDELTLRALAGKTPPELVERYTAWSGRMRALPPWITTGAVIGMQGGTEKARNVLELLDGADVPVAALWLQDWVGQRTTSFGKQLWWNWELDEDHYPQFRELVEELRAREVRVMTYVNPFLVDVEAKENHQRNLLAEAVERGYLVREPASDEPVLIRNTDFSAGLLDLSRPAAAAWMKEVMLEEMLELGISGWMADFGEGLPIDGDLAGDVTPLAFHNAYPVEWAALNRELVDAQPSGDELVFFMRAAYSRSPAFSTLFWLGDQMVDWDGFDGLQSVPRALSNSGFSGFAFNHSDIGGYTGNLNPVRNYIRDPELLKRWTELSVLGPVFRTHEGNIPDDNHQVYDDAASLAHFARMAQLFNAWSDERRRLIEEATTRGWPVTRHPFFHHHDDEGVFDAEPQLMAGPDLLLSPVMAPGVVAQTVRLPEGRWVHLWTEVEYRVPDEDRVVTVSAPLGEPPLFFRSGSPVGEELLTKTADLR